MNLSYGAQLSSVGDLGPDFGRRMNRLADQRFDEEQLQIAYEDQLRPRVWHKFLSLLQINGHLGRYFLSLLGQLCDVDVYGGYQTCCPKPRDGSMQHRNRSRQNFQCRYGSVGKLTWLRRFIRLLSFISIASLIMNSIFQYQYDYHYIRLQTFRAFIEPGSEEVDVSHLLQEYANSPFMLTVRSLQLQEPARANSSTLPGTANSLLQAQLADKSNNVTLKNGLDTKLKRFERRLEQKVFACRKWLEMIGAPYSALHFVIEIIYWFLLTAQIYLQNFLSFYYRFVTSFDLSLLRAILDWRHERRLVNEIILREVNQFICSSRNFVSIRLEQAENLIRKIRLSSMPRRATIFDGEALTNRKGKKGGQKGDIILEDYEEEALMRLIMRNKQQLIHETKNELKGQLIDHMVSCNMLKQMALDGKLMPPNRSLRWLRTLTENVVVFCLVFMGYAYLASLMFAFGFFFLFSYEIKYSFVDVTVIAEAGVIVVCAVAISAFYIALTTANCSDQISYVALMGRKILDCIATNERHFARCILFSNQASLCASSPPTGGVMDDGGTNVATFATSATTAASSSAAVDYDEAAWPGWQAEFDAKQRHDERAVPVSALSRSLKLSAPEAQHERRRASMAIVSGNYEQQRGAPNALHYPSTRGAAAQAAPACATAAKLAKRNRPERAAAAAGWSAHERSIAVLVNSNYNEMNKNLIEVLMHYKIFIAQMGPTIRSFGPFTFGCLVLMISLPTSLRLHLNYLSFMFKLYGALFCLLLASLVDVALVPMCYMHCRSLEMQRRLTSLFAHTLEVSDFAGRVSMPRFVPANASSVSGKPDEAGEASATGQGAPMASRPSEHENDEEKDEDEEEKSARRPALIAQNIYDSHAVWLLRRELDHPERLERQFTINAFGIRFTYATLLRVHFWVSLLSLSMVVHLSSSAAGNVAPPSASDTATPPPPLATFGYAPMAGAGERRIQVQQAEFFSGFLSDPLRVFEM